ncbi:MAG: hypothetical protein H0T78_12300 [Longispora sp.]|nr:hypothetical protein [Longispora sp. (in: high G+C Gram-positive bacteria)]
MSEEQRWQEIQSQLDLPREWVTQLGQLLIAMEVLLAHETTNEANSALSSAKEALELANRLVNWTEGGSFEAFTATAEGLRNALENTAVMLASTESSASAEDHLRDLSSLHDRVDGFAAWVTALTASQA